MTSALLTLCLFVACQQTADEDRSRMLAHTQASSFARAFQKEDRVRLAELMYPKWGEKIGSTSRRLQFWHKQIRMLKNRGLVLKNYDVEPPRELVKVGNDCLLGVLPTRLTFRAVEGKASQESYLLAISSDLGKTWSFIDGRDGEAIINLKSWFKKLPSSLALPVTSKIRIDEEDDERVLASNQDGNFKVSYPLAWEKNGANSKGGDLFLQHGDDIFAIYTDMIVTTLEDQVQAYEKPRGALKPRRLLDQKDLIVAGERAKFFRYDESSDQELRQNYLCIFNHQGIVYRFHGVRRVDDAKAFEQDYLSLLHHFAFLKTREDWVRQYEGAPSTVALLGGLATFELQRPRWTENTFDDLIDQQNFDGATFRFMPGGCWIRTLLYEAQGNQAAELQDQLATYLPRLPGASKKSVTFSAGKTTWPGWELQYLHQGLPRTILMTATVQDGISAWLIMESNPNLLDETRQDWDQLLETFHLQAQSKPDFPLAYPSRRNDLGRDPDPQVSFLLKKASKLYPSIKSKEVIAFSADGLQALISNNGYFLENLDTKARKSLPIIGVPQLIVLSSDQRWVAFKNMDEITVAPLGLGFQRKVQASSNLFVFSGDNKDLLAIVGNPSLRSDLGSGFNNLFSTSRLEQIPLGNRPKKVLLDWPLIRVNHVAVSPSGTQLAVVTNRDYPRTQQVGGLLYRCNVDGSNLKLLNQEPADYRNLAWSSDGKWLYALRRVISGKNQSSSGAYDVDRISTENGEVVPLTRSGKISFLWVGGPDLFIEFQDGSLPVSQQGIFRFDAEDLAKHTQTGPWRNVPKDLSTRVAQRLEKTLGPAPIRALVPTAELMQKLAREFAQAIKEETGQTLDMTPQSLDRLERLLVPLDLSSKKHAVNLLGFGAYYGETLRVITGARWQLKPVPLGDCTESQRPNSNEMIAVVSPFTDSLQASTFLGNILNSTDLRFRQQGQEWLLVHPPAYATDVVQKFAAEYLNAKKLLDQGEVDQALELLTSEMKKRPKNVLLAREVISLCQVLKKPDLARIYTQQAVLAGIESPDLLMLYADELARQDPKQAIVYYRKAAHLPYATPATLIKLGQMYEKVGELPLAESCWRRAYQPATDVQRNEIRRLMNLPPAQGTSPVAPGTFSGNKN